MYEKVLLYLLNAHASKNYEDEVKQPWGLGRRDPYKVKQGKTICPESYKGRGLDLNPPNLMGGKK